MKSDMLCLVLFLDRELRAAFLPPREAGGLIFGSVRLIDQGHGGFMGFHDWLRVPALPKRVVGVRFWPHEGSYLPKSILTTRKYISLLHKQKGFEVWFGSPAAHDRLMTGDQSFTFSRVLISGDKSHAALVLDTYDLSYEERQSIEEALRFENAAWV